MTLRDCVAGGWSPDLPSHRDFTHSHPTADRLLGKLPNRREVRLAESVDLRDFCPPVQDRGDLPTSSAHSCVALAQYYELRACGRILTPSRLFVHHNALRLCGGSADVSLRVTLKAMIEFGFPAERYWPYQASLIDQSPDAFSYGFSGLLRGCRYVRLDSAGQSGQETLATVKSFLAAGFACVFGFPVYGRGSTSADILFPGDFDTSQGGQAALCIGYDDRRRIRSDKGALLLQNSLSEHWGERGYGWLPYTYVERQLAIDFWVLLRAKWLKSGEFSRPK